MHRSTPNCHVKSGQCVCCGSVGRLEVHHIRPVALGGTDDMHNLIGLCASCHKAIHSVREYVGWRGNLVKAALDHCKAERRKYSRDVFGYQVIDGQLVPDPEEQRVIATIRELRAGGESYASIAARLTADGYTTKRGGGWYASTVRGIFINPLHSGVL